MSTIIAIITGICLSACTGFRAFLPPFILGLAIRAYQPTALLFPKLAFIASTPALLALGVAVIAEFLGDKIPWVDHALDAIQLPVKFLIACILTYSIIPDGDQQWVAGIVTLVLGGSTTLVVHTGKASVRATSTALSGGVLNPVISLFEEVFALAGTVLTLVAPLLAGLIILFLFWKSLAWLIPTMECMLRNSRGWRWCFGAIGRSSAREIAAAKTEPSFRFTRLVRFLMWVYLKVYHRFCIIGLENLPTKGPFIVVTNHTSLLDGFIMGVAVPFPTFIMVKKEAFDNPIIGYLLTKLLAFPVDRKKPDPSTLKTSLKALQDGHVLGLFPEGRRSPGGLIRPFKPGALKIALKHPSPIIPTFVAHSHEIMPFGTWFPRPVRLSMHFGPPINLAELLEKGEKEEQIQQIIFDEVCKLGQRAMGHDVRDPNPDVDDFEPPRGGEEALEVAPQEHV